MHIREDGNAGEYGVAYRANQEIARATRVLTRITLRVLLRPIGLEVVDDRIGSAKMNRPLRFEGTAILVKEFYLAHYFITSVDSFSGRSSGGVRLNY
ncbi:MAG: hypothetical protein ABI488_06215 [Polyangiaceae bacterium]